MVRTEPVAVKLMTRADVAGFRGKCRREVSSIVKVVDDFELVAF